MVHAAQGRHGFEESGQFGQWQRTADQRALNLFAGEQAQLVQFSGCFDAFGDRLHAQFARHCRDRLHDGGIAAIGGQVLDEGVVDLQTVHRQVLQVGQGGVTGPEIVDDDLYAETAQITDEDGGALRIFDEGAFGQFQAQQLRRKVQVEHQSVQRGEKVVLVELQGGHIDGDRESGPGIDAQVDAVFQRTLDGPQTDFPDRAMLFGHGQELVGQQQSVCRVMPAQQRLVAGDGARADVDDRLIVQLDLAVFDGLRHFGQELQLHGARVGDAAGEEPHIAASDRFDLVHRRIGAADERLRVVRILWRECDADARRQEKGAIGQDQRPLDGLENPAAQRFDVIAAVGRRNQDDELVSAHAPDRMPGASRFAQPACNFAQSLVAGTVSQRIVDQLVAVQIDIQERGRRAPAQMGLDLLQDVRPIGQTGQGIAHRRPCEPLFSRLALQEQRQRARQHFGDLLEKDLAACGDR